MEPVAMPNLAMCRLDWPKTSFLSRISEAALQSCLSVGRCVQFSARERLIGQGAIEDRDVYLLLSGCVKVTSVPDTSGTASLLAIRVGGDLVGELAAVDGEERSATVTVCGRDPAVCCVVEGATFLRALADHPDALVVLTSTIGAKLRSSTRRRIDFLEAAPAVRMARVLVELADVHGQRLGGRSIMIGVNLKQVELGALIGVREATAQRALRELRTAGLVDTSQRRPIIHDLDRLRALAQSDQAGATPPN